MAEAFLQTERVKYKSVTYADDEVTPVIIMKTKYERSQTIAISDRTSSPSNTQPNKRTISKRPPLRNIPKLPH